MNNNNRYQRSVGPTPMRGNPAVIAADNVDIGFVKGIISAIIAWAPIGSIIAISVGGGAVSLIDSARMLAAQYGIILSSKQKAARILGRVGKIGGIVMTVVWPSYITILIIYYIIGVNLAKMSIY